jgi:hypothetical protein
VELPCPVRVVEGLSYREDLSDAGPGADELAGTMLLVAKEAFGGNAPDAWHIHNHSLGKNAVFPALIAALEKMGQRMLLQIHDFAEDGRPGNYRVARASGAPLYPAGPGIAYAVLNERDAANLRLAGGTPLVLPNAMPEPRVDEAYDSAKALPQFGRLFLYPTRGIRRKNLGEAALFAAVAPEGAGVATSLAPDNPEWIPVHRAWERYAEEKSLPLVLGAAGQGADFGSLCQRAEAWLTTSVAEGFGLAFLEPWTQGKALVGRDLPAITGDFAAEGLDLSNMYSRLDVPVDCIQWKAFIARLYGAMIRSRSAYGRECPARLADEAVSDWVRDGRIDFGMLDELAQKELLDGVITAPGLRAELSARMFRMPADGTIGSNAAVTRARFSLPAYGERLAAIYRDLLAAPGGKPADALDEEVVLDSFLNPKDFRMLRS